MCNSGCVMLGNSLYSLGPTFLVNQTKVPALCYTAYKQQSRPTPHFPQHPLPLTHFQCIRSRHHTGVNSKPSLGLISSLNNEEALPRKCFSRFPLFQCSNSLKFLNVRKKTHPVSNSKIKPLTLRQGLN